MLKCENESNGPTQLTADPILTTSDLVSWSYQIASGMRFLGSHKVVHGDLAARNIYLCDNNVVKIGDFGLAQFSFKTNTYLEKKQVGIWSKTKTLKDNNFNMMIFNFVRCKG